MVLGGRSQRRLKNFHKDVTGDVERRWYHTGPTVYVKKQQEAVEGFQVLIEHDLIFLKITIHSGEDLLNKHTN